MLKSFSASPKYLLVTGKKACGIVSHFQKELPPCVDSRFKKTQVPILYFTKNGQFPLPFPNYDHCYTSRIILNKK